MKDIWHYKHADADMISVAIQGYDWDKAFSYKRTDRKASILTKAVMNIMSKFIPNEVVTIDYRDPSWINNKIKSLIKKTLNIKTCVKPNNPKLLMHFEQMRDALQKNIEISKQN